MNIRHHKKAHYNQWYYRIFATFYVWYTVSRCQ